MSKRFSRSSVLANLNRCWIYGIYDSFGVAVYVGQTRDPKKRQRTHNSQAASRFANTLCGSGQFRIIRETTDANSARHEIQIIAAYWKKGQAQANRRLVGTRGGVSQTLSVLWVEGQMRFSTAAQISRAFRDCGCGQTILNKIRRVNGRKLKLAPNVTLVEIQ